MEIDENLTAPNEKDFNFKTNINKLLIDPSDITHKYFIISVEYKGELKKKDDNY